MHYINHSTYRHDIALLPPDIRAAWIGSVCHGTLARLTDSVFVFRAVSGTGPLILGTLEELLPLIQSMAIAIPHRPPEPSTLDSSAVDELLSELGL
jgi:hypothetical protein